MDIVKKIYNRETDSAAFCAIQWMPFKPPFFICNSNNENPFLNSRISYDRMDGLLANREIFIPLFVSLL